MMQRLPTAFAVLLASVLAFGLLYTLVQALTVAPHAHDAADGRLYDHTKNITRIGGTADEVRRVVWRAVYLDDGAPPPVAKWQDAVTASLRPSAQPRHLVVLAADGDDALHWALPGAYWAAYAGVPAIFIRGGAVSPDVVTMLRRYRAPVYVAAPESLVPASALEEMRGQDLSVTRVAGANPAAHAVLLAEYRDERTGFGWGRPQAARTGYFEYVLAAPADAAQALAALPLARSNAAAFLFAADDGSIPAVTERYVWSQRADWFTTPAEGPFRHLWIIGDHISYAAHGRLDLAPEKAPYLSMGPLALGPLEGLAVIFIALGLSGAAFVLLHGYRLLPDVMPAARAAWAFTALLVPVGGVVLYLAAYRRPHPDERHGMVQWRRPPAVQAAAATAMGFGFGAPAMIAVGYAFAWAGFPIAFGDWAEGWRFLFGAGMPLMMAAMFVGAVLLAWPLAQVPMRTMMMRATPWRVVLSSLGVTVISMAAVSLGMMAVNWWMMMWHAPMMPKEDEVLWFGAMWLASSAGFLVAWPLNWPMVRTGLKPGSM